MIYDIIFQCRNYLEPTEIFKGEVEETIEKVQIAVKILRAFRTIYEEHRAKLKDYFKDKESIEWEFAPQLVFHRYDKFLGRVETVNVSCHRTVSKLMACSDRA